MDNWQTLEEVYIWTREDLHRILSAHFSYQKEVTSPIAWMPISWPHLLPYSRRVSLGTAHILNRMTIKWWLSFTCQLFHQFISGLFYTPFFKEVFEKKSEIEQAMEDASRLDDSGEGTLERPMRQPLPPPR